MGGLLARAGWLFLKFGLKRPLTSIVAADMVTGGHSTDAVLDAAESSGKIIGKDNAKAIGKGVFSLVTAFSEATARVAGKTIERIGASVKETITAKKTTISSSATASQPEESVTPADAQPKTAATDSKNDKDEKSPLSDIFDFSAKGGIGAMLGGISGNPLLMIFGAIMAILLIGKTLGGNDDKPAHKPHHAPAPAP